MLRFIFFLGIVLSFQFVEAQKYLEMMDDISVNFYDVCEEAERYFNTIDKNKKDQALKPSCVGRIIQNICIIHQETEVLLTLIILAKPQNALSKKS